MTFLAFLVSTTGVGPSYHILVILTKKGFEVPHVPDFNRVWCVS